MVDIILDESPMDELRDISEAMLLSGVEVYSIENASTFVVCIVLCFDGN